MVRLRELFLLKAVEGKITGNIIKEIYVPGKIVNIVAK